MDHISIQLQISYMCVEVLSKWFRKHKPCAEMYWIIFGNPSFYTNDQAYLPSIPSSYLSLKMPKTEKFLSIIITDILDDLSKP